MTANRTPVEAQEVGPHDTVRCEHCGETVRTRMQFKGAAGTEYVFECDERGWCTECCWMEGVEEAQALARERYVCPVCGREVMGPDELCSGSFLDRDHPSNVVPVVEGAR